MRYLLDTHTVIWYVGKEPNLPLRIEEIIDNGGNRRFTALAVKICS